MLHPLVDTDGSAHQVGVLGAQLLSLLHELAHRVAAIAGDGAASADQGGDGPVPHHHDPVGLALDLFFNNDVVVGVGACGHVPEGPFETFGVGDPCHDPASLGAVERFEHHRIAELFGVGSGCGDAALVEAAATRDRHSCTLEQQAGGVLIGGQRTGRAGVDSGSASAPVQLIVQA